MPDHLEASSITPGHGKSYLPGFVAHEYYVEVLLDHDINALLYNVLLVRVLGSFYVAIILGGREGYEFNTTSINSKRREAHNFWGCNQLRTRHFV